MKLRFAALAALLIAGGVPQSSLYAQTPPGQPYIQVPIPGIPGVGQPPPEQRRYQGEEDREHREHCERLADREHEMRDRMATAYGEDRERLEHRIREVHEEREHCWRR
jgi:hypothetical protein